MDAPERTSIPENNGRFRTAEGLPTTERRTNPAGKGGPTEEVLPPYPHVILAVRK